MAFLSWIEICPYLLERAVAVAHIYRQHGDAVVLGVLHQMQGILKIQLLIIVLRSQRADRFMAFKPVTYADQMRLLAA